MRYLNILLFLFLMMNTPDVFGKKSTPKILIRGKLAQFEFNFKKANNLFQKGCSQKIGESCRLLGENYEDGYGFQKKEPASAHKYYLLGCKLKDAKSCNLLAMDYLTGECGAVKNLQKHASYARKACDLNEPRGCSNIGYAYENGNGVVKDPKKGKQFYEKACSMKDGTGCYNLAIPLQQRKNFKSALPYLIKGCKYLHSGSCRNLGVYYFQGMGVKKDLVKAMMYSWRGCELGFKESCRNVRTVLSSGYLDMLPTGGQTIGDISARLAHDHVKKPPREVVAGIKETEKNCGKKGGCAFASFHYQLGFVMPKNMKKALYLLKKGCAAKEMDSCNVMTRNYYLGEMGVKKDLKKAKELAFMVCAGGYRGYKNACVIKRLMLDKANKKANP
ncbi:MAG: sel1 repeat family protein [Deltaproteobacteria bacterium]|nr:sel1 repeat family protein [Deltaproteobacteria bacterium]